MIWAIKDVFLSFVVFLPTSKTLGYGWGLGSVLGVFYGLQLLTGVLLVLYYSVVFGFDSVQYLMYDVNWGWLVRIFHFDGASFFYIFLYSHVFKGLFMMSYRLVYVWLVGVLMVLLFMGVGFMGYTLVCSQMSYWAAVVITSMLVIIPYLGESIMYFVWGSFSVVSVTMNFFFLVHFILPWVVGVFVLVHLVFLHNSGSTSILYCYGDYDKIAFFPYFWYKDVVGLVVVLGFFVYVLFFPFVLGDTEMFVEYNNLSSPLHIAPEWYFLFAYTILRAVPSKVLGVVAMIFSVGMLGVLVFFKGCVLGDFCGPMVFIFMYSCFMLTWLGANLPEVPFLFLSQLFSWLFFLFFVVVLLVMWLVELVFS